MSSIVKALSGTFEAAIAVASPETIRRRGTVASKLRTKKTGDDFAGAPDSAAPLIHKEDPRTVPNTHHEVAPPEVIRSDLEAWLGFHEAHGNKWPLKERALSQCQALLGRWPIGDGPGELLAEPDIDSTPVGQRGVAGAWLAAVHKRGGRGLIPTRVMVESFVKRVTATHRCALYFYLPHKFRQRPTAFISHAWDGHMSHYLDHFRTNAKNRPRHNTEAAWLDLIAITEHAGVAEAEVEQIGKIVAQIGNTLLCIPGCGDPYESMRPILRSWCLYEIAETPAGALHVLVGTLNWKEHRHVQNAGAIRDFTTATSEAWVKADKDMIDNLVLKRFGSFEKADTLLRGLIGAAFSAYFAATPGQTHEGKPWVSFAKYYCDGAGRQAGDDSNTPASEVSPEQLDSLHLNL